MGGAIGPRDHTICQTKAMTEPETQTFSNPVTENTPAERDESLEPVDFLTTNQDQLLFYLSGKVPIPIQELATKTVHSAGELRKLAGEEFGETVYIDPSDTVRLTDDAQSQVLRASKVFAERGWNKFDTGRTSFENDSYFDAIGQLLRAQAHFEQLGTRFGAIDITSAVLEERIEDTQNYLEKTRGEIGSLSKLVEPGSVGNEEDAEAESSQQSSSVKDADGPREAMLRVVKGLYRELERIPKTTELPEDCEFTPNDFYSEFGNWDDTLEAAGIDKEQEFLDEIQRVKQKLGRVPNSADMGEYGAYWGANYSSYFGSWSTALERCELKQDRDETLLETLRSLEERLDRLPKASDVRDDSDFSQSEYTQIFGSFAEALEAAGINREPYLTEDLRRVAAETDGELGKKTITQDGSYSIEAYTDCFGSWEAALEAANLSLADRTTETPPDTEEEFLEAIHRVAHDLDHLPSYVEFLNASAYSGGHLINRVETWGEVTNRYRDWVEKTEKNPPTADETRQQDSSDTAIDSKSTEPQETITAENITDVEWNVDNGRHPNSVNDDIESAEFADLTAFERDILIVTSGLDDPKGLDIRRELNEYYDEEVHHGRLYPNLDDLNESGLLAKFEINQRSNGYRLTDRGMAHIRTRQKWERPAIETLGADTDGSKTTEEQESSIKTGENPDGNVDSGNSLTDDMTDTEGILDEIEDDFENF